MAIETVWLGFPRGFYFVVYYRRNRLIINLEEEKVQLDFCRVNQLIKEKIKLVFGKEINLSTHYLTQSKPFEKINCKN